MLVARWAGRRSPVAQRATSRHTRATRILDLASDRPYPFGFYTNQRSTNLSFSYRPDTAHIKTWQVARRCHCRARAFLSMRKCKFVRTRLHICSCATSLSLSPCLSLSLSFYRTHTCTHTPTHLAWIKIFLTNT